MCDCVALFLTQNLERDFQSRVGEIADLQQQLQSTEKEMETVSQQLGVKEAELTTAEEAIRREQQQNWELRQQVQYPSDTRYMYKVFCLSNAFTKNAKRVYSRC